MSRMNELNLTMDELTDVGRQLAACGETLVRAAARMKECFSDNGTGAPEPAEEQATAEPATYTKEEIRAMLADIAQAGFREEAKALVRKYADGGSLTDIDPAKYPDLVAEAEALHG